MNVSGVSPSAGVYSYNSIRLSQIRNQQIRAAREGRSVQPVQRSTPVQRNTPVQSQSIRAVQTYTSFDYAKEYRAGEVYPLKGVDADLAKLDVAKAVSDMEKDHILHQYQFFVGNTPKASLRSGENFIL